MRPRSDSARSMASGPKRSVSGAYWMSQSTRRSNRRGGRGLRGGGIAGLIYFVAAVGAGSCGMRSRKRATARSSPPQVASSPRRSGPSPRQRTGSATSSADDRGDSLGTRPARGEEPAQAIVSPERRPFRLRQGLDQSGSRLGRRSPPAEPGRRAPRPGAQISPAEVPHPPPALAVRLGPAPGGRIGPAAAIRDRGASRPMRHPPCAGPE